MLSISKAFELNRRERDIIGSLRELRKGTAGEILEMLNKKGSTNIPYTTISSVLKRLYTNGMIGRETEKFRGKERKRYVYIYKDIEAEYIDTVVGGLLATFGKSSVVHLAESLTKTNISEEDLKKIRDRLMLGK
ncbi:MAG: BlaI/MecI/CopY family transcriptional regulator [Candidatus Heimdallarchaeota archaeon]